MPSLKAAVIGVGGHGQNHLEMIANEPEMHLVGISDLDNERLLSAAAEYLPEVTSADYREMLDRTGPDVVYVVTLPGHLLPIVQDCLARGIHTSVEKSPGNTSLETQAMMDAEAASSAMAIASLNRRYFPQVLAVKRLALERGGACHAVGTYNKPPSDTVYERQRKGTMPAALICDSIHHIDLVRWLTGDTMETSGVAVEVHAETYRSSPSRERHNAVITFANGARAVLMSHFGVGMRVQRAELHAEDFSAYMDLTKMSPAEEAHQSSTFQVYADGSERESPLDLDAEGGVYFNETRHFAECILNGRRPWSTLEDALATMKLAEAIYDGHKGLLAGSSTV